MPRPKRRAWHSATQWANTLGRDTDVDSPIRADRYSVAFIETKDLWVVRHQTITLHKLPPNCLGRNHMGCCTRIQAGAFPLNT
jgi:hypothetical protein